MQDAVTISSALDEFMQENAELGKPDLVLLYVKQLPAHTELSQLLMAKIVYIYFASDEGRLIYDGQLECCWLFEKRWYATKGRLSRLKSLFQKELLPMMITVF